MSSATVKNPVPPNRVAARDSRSELTSLPPRLPSPRSRPAIRPHALCVLDNKPSFLPPESHFLRTPPLFDQLNERFSLGSETPSSSLVAPYPSRTIANAKTVTTPRVFNRPPFEIQPFPPQESSNCLYRVSLCRSCDICIRSRRGNDGRKPSNSLARHLDELITVTYT